jgi:hypothetical protein
VLNGPPENLPIVKKPGTDVTNLEPIVKKPGTDVTNLEPIVKKPGTDVTNLGYFEPFCFHRCNYRLIKLRLSRLNGKNSDLFQTIDYKLVRPLPQIGLVHIYLRHIFTLYVL